MNIFITGVAGFLGSHLADYFISKGHNVIGCDNLMGGYIDNVNKDVTFYNYECNDLNSMIKITKQVDIIYHCAASAHEGLSSFSPYYISKNTVDASVSVFTAGIVNKVKKIIFCSSMARYGDQTLPYSENMQPKPVDTYGIGKVAAEQYLINLCKTHGVNYTIAVPHNIIGPRQKYDDPYRNVVSIMINLMLQKRQPIIYGDGNQKRCFSYVDDCVISLYQMAIESITNSQIYNIGPDEEFITINELSEIIANKLKFNLNPIYHRDRPLEVKYSYCSSDKIKKDLKYNIFTPLDIGIEKTIEYIKKRGVRDFKYHIDLEILNKNTPSTWKEKLF